MIFYDHFSNFEEKLNIFEFGNFFLIFRRISTKNYISAILIIRVIFEFTEQLLS